MNDFETAGKDGECIGILWMHQVSGHKMNHPPLVTVGGGGLHRKPLGKPRQQPVSHLINHTERHSEQTIRRFCCMQPR